MSQTAISIALAPASVGFIGRSRSRAAAVAGVLLLTTLTLSPWGARSDTAYAAAVPAVIQCNGTDNVGGQAVACDVTVTNNLDLNTGVTSSTLTVRECHGAAGDAALTCTSATTMSTQLATSITQCDGSGNGGGATVTCNVYIVNNITGVATASPATVNQCNGTGQGGGIEPTLSCSPLGVTTSATVTQCNGSGNGGGGSMRVNCTVTPSTETSALPVTVDQCNGSGNGGGSLVTCTVSLINNIFEASSATTTSVTTPVTTTPVSPPPSSPLPETGAQTEPMTLIAVVLIMLGGVVLVLLRRTPAAVRRLR